MSVPMTSGLSSPSGAPESGRALDAMVAEKVMGLTRENWPRICFVDGHSTDEDTWCYSCGGMIDEQEQVPPAFSTDIAAAWMVVEKLRAMRKGETEMRQVFSLAHCYSDEQVAAAISKAALAALPSTGAETAE